MYSIYFLKRYFIAFSKWIILSKVGLLSLSQVEYTETLISILQLFILESQVSWWLTRQKCKVNIECAFDKENPNFGMLTLAR